MSSALDEKGEVPPLPEPAPTSAWETIKALAKRMGDDHVMTRAEALAFETLLAAIPMVVVAFVVAQHFMGREAIVAAARSLAYRYMPDATHAAAQQTIESLVAIDFGSLGIVGIATLLPVMLSFALQFEKDLCDIFRVPARRLWIRAPIYAPVVLLAPVSALFVGSYAFKIATAPFLTQHIVPFLVTGLILFFVYWAMPSLKVKAKAAALGAFFGALCLELAKLGFGIYASYAAANLSRIWGAVSFIPLLLFWMFVSWLLVIVGAEVAAFAHFRIVGEGDPKGGETVTLEEPS